MCGLLPRGPNGPSDPDEVIGGSAHGGQVRVDQGVLEDGIGVVASSANVSSLGENGVA